MNINLEVSSTKNERKRFSFRPFKKSESAWFLEERLERYYNIDECHEEGWETEASFLYISPSKNSHENLFSKIIKKRKEQGWKGKEKYPYKTELSRFIGDSEFRLSYTSEQREVIQNGN